MHSRASPTPSPSRPRSPRTRSSDTPLQRSPASVDPKRLKQHGYVQVKAIGQGSYGVVSLVQDQGGNLRVLKSVAMQQLTSGEQADAVNEVHLLSSLKHPYIVRYHKSFLLGGCLAVIMDYAQGGDLQQRIFKTKLLKRAFEEPQILHWFTQALLALKYLHAKQILHRDLKSANMFLSGGEVDRLCIGDFGVSKVMKNGSHHDRQIMGTPTHLSPEICKHALYTPACDMWAMGVVLYGLATLKMPFEAQNVNALIEKIVNGPIPVLPHTNSSDLRLLCRNLLLRSHAQRPTASEVLKQPFLQAEVARMFGDTQGATDGHSRPSSAAGGRVRREMLKRKTCSALQMSGLQLPTQSAISTQDLPEMLPAPSLASAVPERPLRPASAAGQTRVGRPTTALHPARKRSRSEGAPTRGEEGEPFSPTLSPKEPPSPTPSPKLWGKPAAGGQSEEPSSPKLVPTLGILFVGATRRPVTAPGGQRRPGSAAGGLGRIGEASQGHGAPAVQVPTGPCGPHSSSEQEDEGEPMPMRRVESDGHSLRTAARGGPHREEEPMHQVKSDAHGAWTAARGGGGGQHPKVAATAYRTPGAPRPSAVSMGLAKLGDLRRSSSQVYGNAVRRPRDLLLMRHGSKSCSRLAPK